MVHVAIATTTSVAVILMAIIAVVPTYHAAPVFLLPVIWAIFAFRRRLALLPMHHVLLDSAILLHMSGSFGLYQKWPGPFSFDIFVHYWFALVVTLVLHRALEANFPLKRWQLNLMTFLFMMGLASLHEIMEYSTYLVLGEEKGMLKPSTSYFFDTQRDLLNNLLGTLTALVIRAIRRRRDVHDSAQGDDMATRSSPETPSTRPSDGFSVPATMHESNVSEQ